MSKYCTYCNQEKPVKIWKETNEFVCLSCRISLLFQEFEEVADKQQIDLLSYWNRLLATED